MALRRQLLLLRWLALLGQFLAILIAVIWLPFALPVAALSLIWLGYLIAALLLRFSMRRLSHGWLTLELALDLSVLAALLYYSGGITNPFSSLLLVPLALAAGKLRNRYLLGLALLALIVFALLLRFNVPLLVAPDVSPDAHAVHEHHAATAGVEVGGSLFALHLLGMWFSFATAVALIIGLLTRAASQLRREQQDNTKLRDRILRDESIHAVALHAAHAAHALNSPLNTIALGLDELLEVSEFPLDADRARDIQLLKTQLARCHGHVRSLSMAARTAHSPLALVMVAELATQLREDCAVLEPARVCQFELASPNASISDDGTLRMVVWGLMQNGWRASDFAPIALRAYQHGSEVWLEVLDYGAQEFSDLALANSDGSGLGIGLTLSHASLERIGASLQIFRRDKATVAQIRMPFTTNPATITLGITQAGSV